MQFIAADAGGIDVETGLAIKIEPHPRSLADSVPIAVPVAHEELMANDVLQGL